MDFLLLERSGKKSTWKLKVDLFALKNESFPPLHTIVSLTSEFHEDLFFYKFSGSDDRERIEARSWDQKGESGERVKPLRPVK